MKQLLRLFLLSVPLTAAAQNPIISGQFTADPTARVFNNKVYLYPSHDILPPEGQRQDWFCMEDYHVFSSEDLVTWEDHGMIVSQNNVPWVRPNSYSMWAPDCVERNGKYYFYFPTSPKQGGGFGVGVAIADKPEGPYIPEPEPIKGINGIDPCVLLASDGNAYIFWGAGRCAKLSDNMKELAEDNPKEVVKWGEREMVNIGVNCLQDLPNRQAEGPFAFEYNGNYYLTYPYVRENTEVLAYAMSKNPMGPYEYKGLIMAEHANGCWTNHHSIVNYKGQWYLFYHHNAYSPNDDKRRSVQIEKLYFNEDGTIKEVTPTLRGVGINKADSRIEVDRYSTASEGVEYAYLDTTNTFRGWEVKLPKKGSYITYNDVDFTGANAKTYVIANVKADKNTSIVIRENNKNGKVIARLNLQVEPEGGANAAGGGMMMRRRSNAGLWHTVTTTVNYAPKGVVNLYISCEGEAASIDWVQFKTPPTYFTAATATPAKPDAEGFIRRWTILEPIDKPNRSNTVFTDTYLREHFNTEYFPNQFTIVPENGQKVKVGKEKLTWHKLDSERFNVKLFRFADGLQKQIYGVLFWNVTVIDCPEEIKDVRLAVGSNSASMWWLNGEEVLLLSGDRRMVKDDAVSPRITLKKGINILRGAVINGPGMSDFCVRFIDENENPVTGYEIK